MMQYGTIVQQLLLLYFSYVFNFINNFFERVPQKRVCFYGIEFRHPLKMAKFSTDKNQYF